MRSEKINGKEVYFYDSIQEIPIKNYMNFTQGVVFDMGIGTTPEAISKHYKTIYEYVSGDNKEHALQELNNYHQSLHFILENQNPKFRSFQSLVHLIDGKEPTIHTLDQLNPTVGQMDNIVDSFKKKVLKKLKFFSKLKKQKAN